jgi:hypothetical protein
VDQAARAGRPQPQLIHGGFVGRLAAARRRQTRGEDVMSSREDTDLFDLIEMEDGRIRVLFEFCDPALARMMKR